MRASLKVLLKEFLNFFLGEFLLKFMDIFLEINGGISEVNHARSKEAMKRIHYGICKTGGTFKEIPEDNFRMKIF